MRSEDAMTDEGRSIQPPEKCVAPIEVMIVDRDRGRRGQVSEAFRAEGCHVVEVATSREALFALTDVRVSVQVIVVADTTPQNIAVELRDYLEMYEDAFIVAVGGAEWIPTGARLDPDDSDHLLQTRVHSLLHARAMSMSKHAPSHRSVRISP